MCCGNFLQRIDLLGDNFELNYRGKKTFKTTMGGLCSLIAYFFLGLIILQSLLSLIDKKSPELSSAVSNNEEAPEIDLMKNNVFPIIRISSGKWFNFVEASDLPTLITIKAAIKEVKINQDNPTLTTGSTILPIPYKDCTLIDTEYKKSIYAIKPKIKKLSEGYAFCPDITDESLMTISGDYISDVRRILVINIFPCDSDAATANLQTCAADTVIDTIQTQVTLPSQSFLAEDYETPVLLPLDI